MTRLTLLAGASAVALSACTVDPAGTMSNQESFGNATVITQSAQLSDATAYLRALSAEFRANVPTTVNFAFNSATLDGEAQRVLNRQAAFIRAYPAIQFTVTGHTDAVGSEGYNLRLGRKRADAVLRYLIAQGVDRGQLRAVASRGESQPIIATNARERLNRRAVTDVTGRADARRRGPDMDGKRARIVYNEYVNDAGSEVVTPE